MGGDAWYKAIKIKMERKEKTRASGHGSVTKISPIISVACSEGRDLSKLVKAMSLLVLVLV